LRLKPPTEEYPWDDLRNVFPGFQRMAKVPNGEENCQKLQPAEYRTRCTNVTAQQTDGRAIANVNTFAKNDIPVRYGHAVSAVNVK